MTLNIKVPQLSLLKPKISVFGIGGAGGNALNNMIKSNLEGVEFIAANTDSQALDSSLASERIQLGVNVTGGLGAGSRPDHGRAAAEENIDDIAKYLEDNNMIFITAGMGGGTGTGAAPVVAKLAKEKDILTVGVITKPFHFEGRYRMEIAEAGIEELKQYVDTLIIIPNQNLFRIANEQTTFESAFRMADDVLHDAVRGVTDLITMPGLVNLDFADIRAIMTKMGKAMMGTGEAEGDNRAVNACKEAVCNPLLDDISIRGAKGVLVNMTGGSDMTLFEADIAVNTIRKEVDEGANIIFGSAFNENMKGKIRVSVVATGIDEAISDNNLSASNQRDKSERIVVNANNTIKTKAANDDNSWQNKKAFFDPGTPKNPDQDLEEIQEADFKTHRILNDITKNKIVRSSISNFDESENVNREEESPESPKSAQISEYYNDSNLFRDEDKSSNESGQALELENESENQKKKKSKKESKGFSLFNFMNGSKNKTNQVSEEKDRKIIDREIANVKIAKSEEFDNNIDNQQQQSSGSKIDRTPELGDFILEDDILNVPAFFRRKKD